MKIACLLDNMFEDSEYKEPADALRQAGHDVVVVGQERGREITGYHGAVKETAALGIGEAHPEEFDALLIPGGASPDRLRYNPKMVQFTRAMVEAGKPTFAICHGPQLLMTAEVLRGRRLTAWYTVQDDLRKIAGPEVVDQEVVVDRNLVTSRKPADLPAFNRAALDMLAERARSGE